jgi:hypothetical protein
VGTGLGVGFGVGLLVGFGAAVVVGVVGVTVVVVGSGAVVGSGLVGVVAESVGDVVPWAAEGVAAVCLPNVMPPHPLSASAPTSTDAASAVRDPVRLRSIRSPSLAGGPRPQAMPCQSW